MSNKIKIAIADDHSIFCETLKNMLSNEPDFQIKFTALNGKQLLEGIEKNNIDVVILDLDMPILDGREALHIIRKKYGKGIKVIILSMHYSIHHIERYLRSGANSYLSKSTNYAILTEAIRSVHETGIYFNEDLTSDLLESIQEISKHIYPVLEGDPLSETEIVVLKLICKELSSSEIAEELKRSPRTIENHRSRIMKKIGAKNSLGIMEYAIKNGFHSMHL